jgi:hypothetical protein
MGGEVTNRVLLGRQATASLTFELDASGGNDLGGSEVGGLNIIE